MYENILDDLKALEKPLIFSSKNNYSNLYRIKNLKSVVEELCVRIISSSPPPGIRNQIEGILKLFESYDYMRKEEKVRAVNNTLNRIKRIKKDLKAASVTGKSDQVTDYTKGIKSLWDSIQCIKGIGPSLSGLLSKKNIDHIEDLLFYFPKRYEDRRNIKRISSVIPGRRETVAGSIVISDTVSAKRRQVYQIVITDGSADLGIVWFRFNRKYMRSVYKKGKKLCVNGEITYNSYERMMQIIHPASEDIEIIDEKGSDEISLNFNRIVPIYPLTEGITQRRIRAVVRNALDTYSHLYSDVLPTWIIERYKLLNLDSALENVHYPDKDTGIVNLSSGLSVYGSRPHKTVAFFELFVLELIIAGMKLSVRKKRSYPLELTGVNERKLLSLLPFSLTTAQIQVLDEIKSDLSRSYPMNRLLQGDVGSGKTIVAVIAMLNVVEAGYQAVLMAPTEILAEQHFRAIRNYVSSMNVNISILTGGIKGKQKESIYSKIGSGEIQIIVGTHALIEDRVSFNRLGIVVVDEQHRFGVLQRSKLAEKATNPHVLVMTATPIPRTLAITVYGDLDISLLDMMPPGRKKVETVFFRNTYVNRMRIYSEIRSDLESGRQVYFVCPLIDSTENSDHNNLVYAVELAERLQDEIFPDYRVGLLHGRLPSSEKDRVMREFISNEIKILVSTTVVEVGVDVPNATVMVIENAERFGLSQLHQLRGRIGRGIHSSRCILMVSEGTGNESEKRISIMCRTSDGFRIAEEDLKIRGPGDFLGTKQSGIPAFHFADIVRDFRILKEAREAAFTLADDDAEISKYKALKRYLGSYRRKAGFYPSV